MEKKDTLVLGGHEFTSRFILGSGKFSVDLIKAAVEQGGAQIVTMALRRVEAGQKDNILDYIPKNVTLLPNTSSARTADEAVRIAHLSREIGCGDFIKIEVSPAGQQRNHQSHGNPGQRRLRRPALHVSGPLCSPCPG